jgi:hypothetical protein
VFKTNFRVNEFNLSCVRKSQKKIKNLLGKKIKFNEFIVLVNILFIYKVKN